MQLSQLQIGQRARIVGMQPASNRLAYRQRLIALGLLPGTELTLTRIAPLGDPVEILVRGCAVSLRREEANILELEDIS